MNSSLCSGGDESGVLTNGNGSDGVRVPRARQQRLNEVEFVIVNVNVLFGGINLNKILIVVHATNHDAETFKHSEIDAFAIIGFSR